MINPLSNPSYLLPPLIAVCVIIGLLVLVWQKSQRDFSSQVFCGLLLSLGLWSLFTFGMRSSPDVEHALPWEKALIVVGVPVFVLYYHFTVAYTKIRRKKWIIPAIYSFLVVFVVLVIAPDLAIKGMSLEHYGYAPIIGPIGFLIFAPIPLLVAGGAYNLLKSYEASSSSEERNRLLYLTIAALFPLLGAGLDAFSDLPPASIWSNLIFGIICSIAILKYHLLDIRIVLRRGLAYLLTSVLVAVPFVVLLVLPSLVLAPGLEPWWYGLIILLLAIILRPLYGWAQVLVDKLFYRERYDYLKALQQFSRQAQSIVNVEDLGSSMVRLVSGALRTKATSLLLPSQGNGGLAVISSTLESPPRGIVLRQQSRIVNWLEHHQDTLFSEDFDIVTQLQSLSLTEKNSLEQMGARLYVPIKTRKGELAGVLILGSKLSQQSFSDEDKHLLTALSSQMAMALENARLYSDALRARESLERWLDGMTDCVVIVNIDYTVKFMNRAAIDKLGSRVGENCWNATGKETVCPSCPIQNYVQGSREGLFYSQNIGDREYDIAAAPLLNPDGSLSIVEVLRDITEHKQVEKTAREVEALKQLNQLRTELLSNVSHELRTPLATIKGYSTLLLHYGRKLKRDRQLESLKSIDVAADTLTKLVEQLLTMSRLESGLVKPDKQLTDISEMIRGVVAEAKVWSPNHKVESKLDETLPQVNIDAAQIKEVVNNLIDNAVKYSPEGSAIVMKAREADSEVVISVADQGIGISKKELTKVFDRMYRIEQVVIPGAGGTGLGLAICKALVEAHDGRIWVESEVGKGSTFYLSLPKQTIAEGHSNGKKS